jgi:hypothetical protein
MTYLPEESQIIYRSKDRRQGKIFGASDWLEALILHIGFKNTLAYKAYFER